MKQIVFFGAPDKSHLLLVLGKLLTAAGLRVLHVDSTIAQSAQGYLPQSDERTGAFVTEFEGLDVAGGFITYNQLDRYMKQMEGKWPHYDVMLLDTDHAEFVKGRELEAFAHRVWCSSFEKLALQKNAELIKRLCLAESAAQPLPFFKLLYPFVQTTITEAYIHSHYEDDPVQWLEPVFRIPLDDRDVSATIDNQHHARIDVRKLSGAYIQTVFSMSRTLFDMDGRTVKTALKQVRRNRRGS
ncbi:MAG TPA: hypothetical protein VMS09_07990 [Paenibacillus sp.]|uniref:hypothetical protein n=1 Tax=Paenibacillus sp. TaxID=58172 RepID=UPI002BDB8D4C|nr:hypothetical protein [Paenibacillus sp.]HUC91954.1 hypothetical protein [Paenibacillus sp.]